MPFDCGVGLDCLFQTNVDSSVIAFRTGNTQCTKGKSSESKWNVSGGAAKGVLSCKQSCLHDSQDDVSNTGSLSMRILQKTKAQIRGLEMARLRPLRDAFKLFLNAHEQLGRLREASSLLGKLQRSISRRLSSCFGRWQRNDAVARLLQRRLSSRTMKCLQAWQDVVRLTRRFEAAASRLLRIPLTRGFLTFVRARRGEALRLHLCIADEVEDTSGLSELYIRRSSDARKLLCMNPASRMSQCLRRWRSNTSHARMERRRHTRYGRSFVQVRADVFSTPKRDYASQRYSHRVEFHEDESDEEKENVQIGLEGSDYLSHIDVYTQGSPDTSRGRLPMTPVLANLDSALNMSRHAETPQVLRCI